jgi:hypothetical protein
MSLIGESRGFAVVAFVSSGNCRARCREFRRLSRKEVVPLLVRYTRQRFGQLFELQHLGLSAVEDGLDNVGAEEREAEQALAKLRVTFSVSANSPAKRYCPSSNICFHRCARTSARIIVSSGRGLAGAQASPPSGAMILRPPRRSHAIWMRTVMVLPSNSEFCPEVLRFARNR